MCCGNKATPIHFINGKHHIKQLRAGKSRKTCLTNHTWYIAPYHATGYKYPQGGHTDRQTDGHTHRHANQSNFKKPGTRAYLHTPGLKLAWFKNCQLSAINHQVIDEIYSFHFKIFFSSLFNVSWYILVFRGTLIGLLYFSSINQAHAGRILVSWNCLEIDFTLLWSSQMWLISLQLDLSMHALFSKRPKLIIFQKLAAI